MFIVLKIQIFLNVVYMRIYVSWYSSTISLFYFHDPLLWKMKYSWQLYTIAAEGHGTLYNGFLINVYMLC